MSTPISSISASNTPASPLSAHTATGSQTLGKEEFLRLLVTQLRNQDPMNPLDGQQFAAQLAQFSTVEQLTNLNKTVADQADLQGLLAQSINSGVAAGLIGKRIEAEGNLINWGGSGEAPVRFELASAAAETTVEIRDSAGAVVRTFTLGSLEKGEHNDLQWDGKNDAGAAMPAGAYTVKISATDTAGDPVQASTLTQGVVDRVSFGAGGILLWIGSLSIPMSSVRGVENP